MNWLNFELKDHSKFEMLRHFETSNKYYCFTSHVWRRYFLTRKPQIYSTYWEKYSKNKVPSELFLRSSGTCQASNDPNDHNVLYQEKKKYIISLVQMATTTASLMPLSYLVGITGLWLTCSNIKFHLRQHLFEIWFAFTYHPQFWFRFLFCISIVLIYF